MKELGRDWILMDEFQGTAGKVCSRYKKAYRAARASVGAASIKGVNNIILDSVVELTYHDGSKLNIAVIYGGLNGGGRWVNYLEGLKDIVRFLRDGYVAYVKSDPSQDTWFALIGFKLG
jgi:hypothetical protein